VLKLTNNITKLLEFLLKAERPIFLVGHGLELSGGIVEFHNFLNQLPIPVVWSQGGINVLASNHPLNIGKIGTKGSRAGNFAVQNADLIIAIGSRLSVSTTSQDYHLFGREAKLVVVDIDDIEHHKDTVDIDVFFAYNARDFIGMLQGQIAELRETKQLMPRIDWIKKCKYWKKIFKVYQPEYAETDKINLYYFIEELSKKLRKNDVVVADAGSAMFVTSQGLRFKKSNKVILSHAQAEMGFTIPACIGVAFAKKGDVIGICGDGSFQMNIQELQTIKHHNLPIKLFVLNNNGYLTIRNTHNNFFGRVTGADPKSGVSFPDISKIAYAYGLNYFDARSSSLLPYAIDLTLETKGPVICEVPCLENQDILTIKSKRVGDKFVSMPLEDMYPYLPREVFLKEMIVPPIQASKELKV